MKKAVGIFIITMGLCALSACSKKDNSSKLSEETKKIEIQVPTLEPTPTASLTPSEMPTAEVTSPSEQKGAEQESQSAKEEEVTSSPEIEQAKMEDYFTIQLPEEAVIQYNEKEFKATIRQAGKKLGEIKVITTYPKKVSVQDIVTSELEEEGYLKEVRTYEKGAYKMVKTVVSSGISKEDQEHGKLIGGDEKTYYLYYKDTIPTSLMILSMEEDLLEETKRDEIAKSVVLQK